ncbi:type 1 glutamine amidotransferase domain-containing protein [Microbulbifer marinus]|uniref:Putative intracellular protease/amidase n=1 Tax=Microbulbifer marinus TaxID=658218 RepID=A0A1H4AZG1_9GAMM|nr:type 1 glutamine amidotransferase domain-containing protein [Microbulbifer marinus]SEA41303.1 Putative intracellular protease/amidase [Microbulbifer marinus]
MVKKLLLTLSIIALSLFGTGFWLKSLIPPPQDHVALAQTSPSDLNYLQQITPEKRGKILAVVTSTDTLGNSGQSTGYELTELSRPYYVFTANGFEVDIASTAGGIPPVVIDKDDMGPFDYAFLNDKIAQRKVNHTIPIEQVQSEDYQAVFFVGGKGAMFDFPDNPSVQKLVRQTYISGGVIGAVCHGPAALVNVKLPGGEPLLANRRVSGFTNEEELFLIPDAPQLFPFLLEDGLRQSGAIFEPGPAYLKQISIDGRLLTGQNPWSVWPLAEAMVEALGNQPTPRSLTPAELTVELLLTYEQQGIAPAQKKLLRITEHKGAIIDRRLLAMHGIVAIMRGQLGKAVDIVRLLAQAKSLQVS